MAGTFEFTGSRLVVHLVNIRAVLIDYTNGGSKGCARDAPTLGPISFNFMQFLGKKPKIIG